MADDVLTDIFGGNTPKAKPAVQQPGAVGTGLTLNVTEDDLNEAQGGTQYPRIPKGTRVNATVTDVLADISAGAKTNGAPRWTVTLVLDSDEYGANRTFREFVTFSGDYKFMWLPFVKAAGLLSGAGSFTIPEVGEVIGKKVSAQVIGYDWTDEFGERQRDYGKKEHRKIVPAEGRVFEKFGNFEEPVTEEQPKKATPAFE